MQKGIILIFGLMQMSFCIFFSVLRVITLKSSCRWRIHLNWKDSTADSDVAEQTGRLPPLRNARKRELESTFRDSDWPSFNNAVYALSLLLSPSDIFLSLPPSQTAEQPNQSCKVNIKVLLWKVTGSHRTADCWTPARGWFTLMTTVVQSWISVF